MSTRNDYSNAISALVAILAIGAILSIVIFASSSSAIAISALAAVTLLAIVFIGGPSVIKVLDGLLREFGSFSKLSEEERK